MPDPAPHSDIYILFRMDGKTVTNEKDYNNDHKETRRHVSLDGMDYEGEIFAAEMDTESEAESREDISQLYYAMESLSPAQRELVLKVFFEKVRVAEIARAEGDGGGCSQPFTANICPFKKVFDLGGSVLPFPWPNYEGFKNIPLERGER